jgi:hypothetical protein
MDLKYWEPFVLFRSSFRQNILLCIYVGVILYQFFVDLYQMYKKLYSVTQKGVRFCLEARQK